jgi:SAM-dependent methyltransferase
MDLKEVGVLGADVGDHWYYASKALALQRCLADRPPQRILDVGAGSGFFSKMLLRTTTAKSAICVDPGYLTDWSETELGKPIHFRRQSTTDQADVVLLMDVIEHVDDDVDLLRTYAASARPGTRFIVSVPAFAWMWSPHDDFLEHRRRYTLDQASTALSTAGIEPVAGFYFFAALFPPIAAVRLLRRNRPSPARATSDLRRHHPLTNRLLSGICRVEASIATHNRLFGLTAFAVGAKR